MVSLINRITSEAQLIWVALLALVTALAIIALLVVGLIAFFTPDREKHAAFSKAAMILVFCVVIGAASSLISWAMSI